MAIMNCLKTDRGQLILVTGLTIAVILVALVILLNTVIYTENLATRGIDVSGGNGIEYRATVIGSVGELIDEENERFDDGYPPTTAVDVGIELVSDALAERHLAHGAIAETHLKDGTSSITTGSSIIWQTDDREFISTEESADWTVATDVTDTERFVLTVTPDEEMSDPFTLVIDEWSMEIEVVEIENDNDTDEVEYKTTVTVADGTDSTKSEYNYTDLPLNVDLVNGTIEPENQPEPTTINPAPPTTESPASVTEIGYENGDQATGAFELQSDGTPDGSNLNEFTTDTASETGPYYTYTVASVDLEIHYESTELQYTTEATVPAGEEA